MKLKRRVECKCIVFLFDMNAMELLSLSVQSEKKPVFPSFMIETYDHLYVCIYIVIFHKHSLCNMKESLLSLPTICTYNVFNKTNKSSFINYDKLKVN